MKKILLLILSFLSMSAYANTFSAMYLVPVNDSELEAVSHFVISDVTISDENGKEKLKLSLPVGLVGPNRNEIKMSKTFSPIPFVTYYKGEGVGAICVGQKSNKLVCKFKGYEELQTNLEDIRDFWVKEGASELEIQKRLKLADRFSSEPIGKLILKRK